MSELPHDPNTTIDPSAGESIAVLSAQFEAAWRKALRGGSLPSVDVYLAQVPESERTTLNDELTRIDAERAAGVCASKEGLIAGAGSAEAAEFTSVADGAAVNRKVPFCTGENVQANVRVERPGTVWLAGALVICAAPVPASAGVPGTMAAPVS